MSFFILLPRSHKASTCAFPTPDVELKIVSAAVTAKVETSHEGPKLYG